MEISKPCLNQLVSVLLESLYDEALSNPADQQRALDFYGGKLSGIVDVLRSSGEEQEALRIERLIDRTMDNLYEQIDKLENPVITDFGQRWRKLKDAVDRGDEAAMCFYSGYLDGVSKTCFGFGYKKISTSIDALRDSILELKTLVH